MNLMLLARYKRRPQEGAWKFLVTENWAQHSFDVTESLRSPSQQGSIECVSNAVPPEAYHEVKSMDSPANFYELCSCSPN